MARKKQEFDVSEMDNNQFQMFTVQKQLEELEVESRTLFTKMFQVHGSKRDLPPGSWVDLKAKYRVCDCKVGDYFQTMSTIYKRVA